LTLENYQLRIAIASQLVSKLLLGNETLGTRKGVSLFSIIAWKLPKPRAVAM
jgi:hypothetical protein